MVTDSLITRIVNYLDSDIGYIGIGTGTNAITETSTLLDNETYRKATTNIIDENTLILEAFWDETEANGNTYTEAGCFGNSATVTLDTGELFVGGAINVEKDNTQSLTISIEITVEAVN